MLAAEAGALGNRPGEGLPAEGLGGHLTTAGANTLHTQRVICGAKSLCDAVRWTHGRCVTMTLLGARKVRQCLARDVFRSVMHASIVACVHGCRADVTEGSVDSSVQSG